MNPIHLSILGVVAAAFLMVQIFTYVKLTKWINASVVHMEKLLSGQLRPDDVPAWIERILHPHSIAHDLSAARAISLDEIEGNLTPPSYMLLQKTSVMSPLIGVILTSIGFLFIGTTELANRESNLSALIAPLASGVAAGAALAMVGQILLQAAESKLEELRVLSRRVVDERWAVQVRSRKEPETQFIEATKGVEQATQNLDKSVATFAKLMSGFPQDVSGITERFDAMNELSRRTHTHLSEMTPKLAASLEAWHKAICDFQHLTDERLVKSVSSMESGAEVMFRASEGIQEFLVRLTRTASNFDAAMSHHESVVKQIDASFQEKLLPQHEAASKHLLDLGIAATDALDPLRRSATLIRNLLSVIEKSDSTVEHISSTVTSFHSAIEHQLIPSSTQYLATLGDLRALSTRLQSSLTEIERAVTNVADSSEGQQQIGRDLASLIRDHVLPTVNVLQRATSTFDSSAQVLSEVSDDLRESTERIRLAVESELTGYKDVAKTSVAISQLTKQLETWIDLTSKQADRLGRLEESLIKLHRDSTTSARIRQTEDETTPTPTALFRGPTK